MATNPDDEPTLVLTEEERAERARIIAVLSDVGNNATDVPKRLGITRRALIEKLTRYRTPRPMSKDRA